MNFEELWVHLEQLPESEVDSIYRAAGSDKTYRAQVVGLFVACLCGLAALSFAVPALYRAYHPGLLAKLAFAALLLGGIWLGVGALHRLNQGFYNSAVMRQIRARGTAGGPNNSFKPKPLRGSA